MVVKITGQITQVLPIQQGVSQRTGNAWMSQEYVIQHDFGQYPKFLNFRVFGQAKIAELNIQLGQQVTLSLDLNAHENNGRWYNEISAFKVEYPQMQGVMPQQQMQGGMQMPPMQGGMPPQQQMPPMQGSMPPQQQIQPQQQGCQTYNQYGANQMGYNVPQQGGMPPQQPMPQQAPPQQQAPFPPQQ